MSNSLSDEKSKLKSIVSFLATEEAYQSFRVPLAIGYLQESGANQEL